MLHLLSGDVSFETKPGPSGLNYPRIHAQVVEHLIKTCQRHQTILLFGWLRQEIFSPAGPEAAGTSSQADEVEEVEGDEEDEEDEVEVEEVEVEEDEVEEDEVEDEDEPLNKNVKVVPTNPAPADPSPGSKRTSSRGDQKPSKMSCATLSSIPRLRVDEQLEEEDHATGGRPEAKTTRG